MTVRIGRRRITLSLAVTSHHGADLTPLPGADDAELARLSRRPDQEAERARLGRLALLYGASLPR